MEFVLSLVIGIWGAIHLKRHKDKPPSVAFYILMLLLACWPMLGQIGLYFLALEYQHLFGVWPQPMLNDPHQQFGEGHETYDAMYLLVEELHAFALAWAILFLTFLATNWFRLSNVGKSILSTIGVTSLGIFLLWDFDSLFKWWLD